MGHQPFRPGQPFADQVDAALKAMLTGLREQGVAPDDAVVNMNVTGRTDDEVEVVRDRAAAAGLTRAVLVDDHRPPRPGTVTSASLSPLENSVLVEARAERILNDK